MEENNKNPINQKFSIYLWFSKNYTWIFFLFVLTSLIFSALYISTSLEIPIIKNQSYTEGYNQGFNDIIHSQTTYQVCLISNGTNILPLNISSFLE